MKQYKNVPNLMKIIKIKTRKLNFSEIYYSRKNPSLAERDGKNVNVKTMRTNKNIDVYRK